MSDTEFRRASESGCPECSGAVVVVAPTDRRRRSRQPGSVERRRKPRVERALSGFSRTLEFH